MSGRRNTLTPPAKEGLEDPGAHELESSASGSDDHFSDAQSAQARSASASPIPKTRVEKVSDEPSYGEVPGTEAYKKREGDAEPDEIAVIPDGGYGKDAATPPEPRGRKEVSGRERSPTPGGRPIPLTMVEESAGGSMVHTHPEVRHEADEAPDLRVTADGKAVPGNNATDAASSSPTTLRSPTTTRTRRKSSVNSAAHPLSPGARSAGFTGGDGDADDDGGDDDAFGDDFDDFEEGGDDADFGDFDDGFQEPTEPAPAPPSSSAPAVQPLSFPIPDFDGMDPDDILAATEPYLNALYPVDESDAPAPIPPLARENPVFLTPRSASLWSQLVAPPPLQPPDWIRSRIRRLFLVSLGVPVDLDEILPASKQKKLVLPSLRRAGSSGSLRTSTDSRSNAARLRPGGPLAPAGAAGGGGDANASSTSLDSQGGARSASAAGGGRRRKGPPPEPDLDLVAARQLCTTTDEALGGMTDEELRQHVARLKRLEVAAKEVLDYWSKRTDEKIGDREAFEGVIENLVKHARKVRK